MKKKKSRERPGKGSKGPDEGLLIPGFHTVREALDIRPAALLEVWVSEDKRSQRLRSIREIAAEKGIPVREIPREEFDRRLPGVAHQGVAARAREMPAVGLETVAQKADGGLRCRLVIAADHITDEGNLGAMIRTAAFFGADALLLPRDRSAGITGRVVKSSAGASLFLPTVQVVNLSRALDFLIQEGFWVIGAAGEAEASVYDFDWNRDTVLVMGREERGISPNVRARCHQLVAVPGCGRVESLNVSVAAGVILSEIQRQRAKKAAGFEDSMHCEKEGSS